MSRSREDKLHQALIEPLVPALTAGSATGLAGFLVGGAFGTLRSAHPGLAGLFTGTQFFVLGSSFFYTRDALLHTAFPQRTARGELISSTAAGAISGAAAGAFYGRVNSVAGALFVGTVGHLGQRYVHANAGAKSTPTDKRPYIERLASSKWIPLKSISNTEYELMLNEQLLKVESEISMLDEKILALRHGQDYGSNVP